MKKYIAGTVLSLLMVFSLTGCAQTSGEFSAKDAIKIEDIDWHTTESILDGDRIVSFNYTNNSKYTILDVEMTFKQKPDVTKEQLSAFDDYIELHQCSDEEIKEIYILGYNRKVAEPKETVSDSPCCINGTYSYVESAAQLDIMEPDMATIVFEGRDQKGYTVYYDFKSKTYSESSEGGIDLHQWSDSGIADQIPKIDAPAVIVSNDSEDYFSFKAFGVTGNDFREYVNAVKEKGFETDCYESNTSYSASNAGVANVYCTYTPADEELSVRIIYNMTK